MPEMNIGFFPDVGAAYFLNKAPGYTGRYAALTSKTFGAADVLYMEAAEYHIQTEQLVGVLEKLKEVDWHAGDVRKKSRIPVIGTCVSSERIRESREITTGNR